jgi:C-methyltransferase
MKIRKLKNKLKGSFTQYWDYLIMRVACRLDVFDYVAEHKYTAEQLCQKINCDSAAFGHLLGALLRQGLIQKTEKNKLKCSKLGLLLTDKSPDSLKNACLLWGQEHLEAWANLEETLRTGKPSFERIYAQPFFDYLQTKADKLKNYQLAMRDYARDDYKKMPKLHNFGRHRHIIDVGGGTGELIGGLAKKYPETQCTLFDLAEVVELAESLPANVAVMSGTFFEPLPLSGDAIILARVLHDWDDERASQILSHCRAALTDEGRLYVLEIMQEKIQADSLCLNMMLMCKSYERESSGYEKLLAQNGLKVEQKKRVNDLQTMLICKKIN